MYSVIWDGMTQNWNEQIQHLINESLDKSDDYLYSLIVVFWFDAKSPLVQMITHNHWSIPQQLSENQQNKYQRKKLSSFNVFKTRTERYGIDQNKTVCYEMWQKTANPLGKAWNGMDCNVTIRYGTWWEAMNQIEQKGDKWIVTKRFCFGSWQEMMILIMMAWKRMYCNLAIRHGMW